MVSAYRETPEDRLLIEKPYRLWQGTRIDIRWSGGWLTPDGEYYPVDYKNGITHETIATEHGNQILGSGSIMTRTPIMRIFDVAKWMRITYHEYSSFCCEFKGSLSERNSSVSGKVDVELEECRRRRQTVLLSFVREFSRFDDYFLNNTKHESFKKFKTAISKNAVRPRSN